MTSGILVWDSLSYRAIIADFPSALQSARSVGYGDMSWTVYHNYNTVNLYKSLKL